MSSQFANSISRGLHLVDGNVILKISLGIMLIKLSIVKNNLMISVKI